MKIIIVTFTFFIIFLISLPKENIYYFFENKLKNNDIDVVHNTIDENHFSLSLDSVEVLYKTINVFDIKNISMSIYLVSNQIEINNLTVNNF